MTASETSLAETSVSTDKGAIVHNTATPPQGAQAVPGLMGGSESAPGMQNTSPNTAHENGYTAVAIGAGLEFELRTSLPPPAAALDAVSMTTQAKDLNVSKADKLVTQVDTDQSATVAQGSRRSSRAAAVAANAGMARQAQEEERPLGILLPTSVGGLVGASESRKRSSDLPPAHKPKKSKTTEGGKVLQNTLEMESEEPRPQRGKKRRQAPVFEAAMSVVEASPIITDLPPLPFTASPKMGLKGKKTKNKTKKTSLVVKEESDDSRHCEFCKKVANICVLMHCHACRRVYHPGCFVHAFKPFIEENVPILNQMERLQLEAPERRGNIFRCASCKAAFIDFYESGGYLWDCQCPTCSQPEKGIHYRQRKLVQMMNDMELEKQRKRENKGKKQAGVKSGGKMPAARPSRSNSVSRGRRTRGSVANEDERKDTVAMKTETEAEPMDVGEGENPTVAGAEDQKMEVKQEMTNANEKALKTETTMSNSALKEQPIDEPEAQPAVTPQKDSQLPNVVKYEPAEEPKLSGDELVKAVAVEREDEHGHWCFPVTCSRTSSLRASGVMKRGNCKWSAKRVATIHCECCDKKFSFSEFVYHTDSSLVKDPKCAQEDPMPFLFVEHRDNTLHTPLEDFLPDLRSWVGRQSANNTPTKLRKGRAAKQEGLAAVVAPTTPDAEMSMSRLRELALFKRPKHRTDKTSLAARLLDAMTFEFLAEVVCLSPKYVMNMANGSLADRVVRSKTSMPDDSFPRKVGWLVFSRKGKSETRITCVCCEQRFGFDKFVEHAGISLTEHQKRARHHIYIVEKLDKAALMPFTTFVQDLTSAATANVLELYLGELHPPSPSNPGTVNTLVGSRTRVTHP
ncbi:hypothetical protein P3T76_001277 [Phytophthora citrophthora]|uniref:Tify domain-containing protein n=1 Tax=Phytophthora citrophthora TaxID=4793 RepID=A0AAD9GYX2_9STRA|nr:hypothetical protein P3T76_001277 [Phytophthora citrophthora]